MSNINTTKLWSDNPEKFDEIITGINFFNMTEITKKPGEVIIYTASRIPHDEIVEISAKHPNMTFLAEFSFEYEGHDTIYRKKYKNGEYQTVKISPGYCLSHASVSIKESVPCYDVLKNKLISLFERLDIERHDDNGICFIDWVETEVTATVEHNGYRMQATKQRNFINDIKLYKSHKVEKIEWWRVNEDQDVPPLPF